MAKDSKVAIVEKSSNAKTGKSAATYAPLQTCPDSCPFKDNGCYAQSGPASITFNRITKNAMGCSPVELARIEAEGIRGMSGKLPLRLHVSGDCADLESAELLASACEEYMSKHNQPVWAYTHNWRVIPRSAWGKISILASCESEEQVREAKKLGYNTALVTTKGREEVTLPTHQCGSYRGLKCSTCAMCWQLKLHGTVIFRPHGARKKRVVEVLKG